MAEISGQVVDCDERMVRRLIERVKSEIKVDVWP